MMGQHISKVTYYTSRGIYEIPVDDLYVPVKFEGSVKVEDADVSAGSTAVTVNGLPEDFDAGYTVEGLKEAAVKDGTLTFSKEAEKGQYTLTVTDGKEKYAPLRTTFILKTAEMPAEYNGDDSAPALTAAEGAGEEAFKEYLKNITSVTVNETSYTAAGRGAVVIIKEDGSIDTGVQDGAVFGENGAYEITVSSTGYHDLTFTYTKAETAAPENPGESENPTEAEPPAESENPTEPETSEGEGSHAVAVADDGSQGGTGTGTGTGSGTSSIGGAQTSGGMQNSTGTGTSVQSETAVKTGDSNVLYLWISLLILSLCGGGCVIIFKRRKDV